MVGPGLPIHVMIRNSRNTANVPYRRQSVLGQIEMNRPTEMKQPPRSSSPMYVTISFHSG
jgi:hypothetical protein